MDDRTKNVADFGAVGDGKTRDTAAIQAAIDSCARQGGGQVYFPPGGRFLTGTLFLRSHITLRVAENAVILGSADLADYSDKTGTASYAPEPLDRCLIYAKDAEGVTFCGSGCIDGGFRDPLTDRTADEADENIRQRPMLIRFDGCRRIAIRDLSLKGAYSWCVHLKDSSDVVCSGVSIDNDRQDGFNIESCRDVRISDCNLRCGDDGIAFTTNHADRPLRDVTVTNCTITSRWAAVRLGPLSKGNFENITISGCTFRDCGGGGIKIGMFEGAGIRNCVFTGIVMDRVSAPILIMNARWTRIGDAAPDASLMPIGRIENLLFSNMTIRSFAGPHPEWDHRPYSSDDVLDYLKRPDRNGPVYLHGHREAPLKGLVFSNIILEVPGGRDVPVGDISTMPDMHEIDLDADGYWTDDKTTWGVPPSSALFGRHLENLELRTLSIRMPDGDPRPALTLADARGGSIKGLSVNGRSPLESEIKLNRCRDLGGEVNK